MKIGKRVRRGYALALAFLLTLPGLVLLQTQTQAADAIDVDRRCSLTVSVEGNFEQTFADDLNGMTVPVSLYKVASVDEVGRYTGEGPCAGMKFDGIGSGTTAEDWTNLAKEAQACLEGTDPLVSVNLQRAQGAALAQAKFKDLETGMYLAAPQAAFNADYSYEYTFTPYLTALPGNAYASVGGEGYGQGEDSWNYDPVIGLKPERERQAGSLTIQKELENYNTTLGPATFVFQAEGRDENGEVVYSDVVSLTFSEAGSGTATLEGIPAGLLVTVTEIYSGASYVADGPTEIETIIVSDKAPQETARASVSFTNRYGGGNRGGYGVTNHFDIKEDGTWDWTPDVPVTE